MSPTRPLNKLLKRLFDVRPEEAQTAVLFFFYFFLITATAYIIIPVKISLYLEWLSFEKLPYAYLLTAVLIGFVVTLNAKLLHSLKREKYITYSHIFFIANLFIFWVLFKTEWKWLSMLFWFWEDIFLGTSVTQYWILVNDFYKPRQTKRLLGFLISGGLLGGVAGSLIASVLAIFLRTENLLLVCPALLVVSLMIVRAIHKQSKKDLKAESRAKEKKTRPATGFVENLQMFKKNRHLLLLCAIVGVSIIVATMIDFQFSSVVENEFTEPDLRTAFLGKFFMVLLIFSYLLHVFTTNHILKNFGLRFALLIAPFFLLLGSVAIFALPFVVHIFWAVYLKGADKSLAHSLNQSVKELLFIPLPPEIKYKSKVFIDMFVSKFAKGIGAIFLLVAITVFHFSYVQISYLTIIFIAVWVGCNILITKEYVNIVKNNLSIKWQEADDFLMDKVDIDTTKLIFDTIESKNRSSVLYAMNLFDLVKKDKMSSSLKKIISNKSSEIQASSMDSLFNVSGGILFPELDDSLDDENIDTQIKEIMEQDVYKELMNEHFDKVLHETSESGVVPKMEAAKAIGFMPPDSSLTKNLGPLLKDKSAEVLRYALESAGKIKKRKFLPLVIQQLSNPRTQRIASQALIDYGPSITGTLKDYLSDLDENVGLRKEIPDILARIGTQKAADSLALEFKKKHTDVNNEVIEALFKLRSNNPKISIHEEIIIPEIIQVIRQSYMLLFEIHESLAEEKDKIVMTNLETNLANSLKHIFELLSLIYAREDIIKTYQNITTGEKKAIDYSVELLDNILKKDLRDLLLPLIDDISFEDKIIRCKKMLKTIEKNSPS